jgi:tetratricopeptide (TPR) repeat protein/transglutaminase-like putative cysteine protease
MKGLWVTVLCLLSLPLSALAQESPTPPGASENPDATKTQAQKQTPADYSQEPFVIEQYFSTARYENDGTGQRDVAVRIRVQSDAGVQQLGQLVFGYSSANEQMDVRYVRVRKSDGSVVTADADAIKDMTGSVARDAPVYTDYKEKHITVPALAPGETLEYEIATRLVTPLAPGEFWLQHNFVTTAIALDERLEIDVPEHRKINLESSPDFPYETISQNGRTIYRWKHSNLTRPDNDSQKKKKSVQKPEAKAPDVQLTTFTNWEAVSRWYAKLEQGRTDPTPEIRAKTAELIQGRTTDLDKMQALYNYVSKSIRYVSLSFGVGRYQPHSAGEIFANQYGDCKDKHTLLASMLQAAGIPSDAVLISYTRKTVESMPSPSQFDHMITAVPRGNELIWMDSTAEVAPFRLLSSPLRKKSALLVPADGKGKIVETPADPPFLSTQRVEIDAQVSDLGKLTAHAHYTMRGDTELVLRLAFRRTPQTQWKQLGQTILTLDGLSGDVTSVKPSDPTDTQNPFELDLDFTQSNFLDWSSKKAKAPLPLLAIGLPNPPDDEAAPVELGSPLNVSVRLKLDLPPAFTAQAPIAVSVSRDYAEFKSSYHFADHTLTAERSLDFKIRELPASRTSDYLAFNRAVTADETQALVVENAAPGAPGIPSSAKADDLFEAALAALNSGNTRAAIPLFQRVVALDPQHKQAWNDLGLAYLRDGKYDDAASAFRKQLDVNSFDEHANDYLGLALEQQQKYTEAIAAFRKQLESNPLDLMAHAALGEIFIEQHDYPQAVPELEKATILSPDNAQLQVNLGRAYLNTNEKDKALAAFEKAADLSQTPVVWNDIAYDLADNRIELDKAQQYAESAVSSTAAALRNISLKNLTLDRLTQVTSIGAYWDTLGWVYFRKGDLQKAARYISAGWMLEQHGEVGDHLAQIYEKLGEKDRAAHTYALALAAPHSVPETRARLTLLLGGNAGIDDLVKKARPDLVSMRSFPLKGLSKEDAAADFLILFSPDGADGTAVKVEAVKFVSGDETLRPFEEKLSSLDYGTVFPDASPIKLVRRGTLSCSAKTGDCTFTLILPEDVHAVN